MGRKIINMRLCPEKLTVGMDGIKSVPDGKITILFLQMEYGVLLIEKISGRLSCNIFT